MLSWNSAPQNCLVDNFPEFLLQVKGAHPVACSAITHSDGQLKQRVSLIWVPPHDVPHGNVIFMATVVKSYSNYYSNLIAAVPAAYKARA